MKKYLTSIRIATFFCILCFIGVLFTAFALILTHGRLFSEIFWYDVRDTGMDFFHSIEYVRGRSPYEQYQTLYPPLANFIFLIVFRFIPLEVSNQWGANFYDSLALKATAMDVRLWQSTMMMFIIFNLATALILLCLIQNYFGYGAISFWVGMAAIFSYGILYTYERGNIVILALIFSMFFVFYKDSSNKIISELALISLAIASGLKLYPALLGCLLLYDKQIAKAIRTVLYGIFFFIVPIFFFHEGLYGIKLFGEALSSFTSANSLINAADGFSFTQILSSITLFFHSTIGISLNENFLLNLFPKISLIVSGLLLLCGFKVRTNWQKSLVCCVAMLSYSYQADYAIIFFLIPLFVMIKEENVIKHNNVFISVFLIFSQTLLPISGELFGFWRISNIRLQFCMLAFILYILYISISNSVHKIS